MDRRKFIQPILLVLILLSLGFPWLAYAQVVSAQENNPQEILILNSYHYGFEWSDDEMEGLFSQLPASVNVHTEFMDTKRNDSESYLQTLFVAYKQKYGNIKFDLIITLDDPAFQFTLQHREELFGKAPVLFLGVNDFQPKYISGQHNITGVVEVNDFTSINTDLRLYPKAKSVFIITDDTLSGQANRKAIENMIDAGVFPVPLIFLDGEHGLTQEELLTQVSQLPPESIVYYADFFRDADGTYIDYQNYLPQLSEASPAPIFAHAGMYLGHGIVGGKLGTGFLEGEAAGKIANQILSGEPASAIPVNTLGSSAYQFDSLQLQRWDIHRTDLPKDSRIINQTPSLYEQNKRLFWGVLIFVILQSAAIFVMLAAILQRNKAQARLRESENRYRSIFEENPSMQLIVDPHNGRIYSANPAAAAFYGYSTEELASLLITNIDMRSNETIFSALKAIADGNLNQFICKHRLKNGDLRDIEVYTGPITIDNQLYLFATLHDVTERVESEREMEIIAQIAKDLRSVEKSEDVYQLLLNYAMSTSNAESAVLAWKNNLTQQFLVVKTTGQTSLQYADPLPDISSISTMIHQQKSVQLKSSQIPEALVNLFPGVLDRAISIFPLLTGNEVVGVLVIKSHWDLTHTDMRSLTTVCEIVASSLLRFQLIEETQLQVKRLNALHAIDKAITTNTHLDAILEVVLEQVTRQLDVAAARIMLYQPATLTLETSKAVGFHNMDLAMRPCRLGVGLSGQVAAERRTINISDIYIDNIPTSGVEANSFLAVEDFQAYFGAPLVSKGQIKGVIEVFNRTPVNASPEWLHFFETLSRQATIAVDEATLFEDLERSNIELVLAYDNTLEGWSRALELRDYETKGHSERVTDMTVRLSRRLGLPESEISQIRRGALLHDIGKMGIPDHILHKPGPLTNEEWEIMQKHPIYAFEMLSRITYLRPALDIPYYHHEKWDGTGYPFGLQGNQIPLPARIFAMVDVWDALASDRPYRKAWSPERIKQYMKENAGTHFDPQLIAIFLQVLEEDAEPALA
ncbi:MAG: HD domain-containing protein [Chloroflexi bacterium]|nr:HD domain-containing protein [Chloroflexota bacterium]